MIEGRRKKEEGRRKKEEGRRKKFLFPGRTWERISLLLCLVIFKRRQSLQKFIPWQSQGTR
ncbi:hypothetical protein [Microcoleus vaginatus]|uniref:hypothetical protein n=1 Tax=Microcoleus vaginatus TaxID=119532 RepID=UPI0002F4E917